MGGFALNNIPTIKEKNFLQKGEQTVSGDQINDQKRVVDRTSSRAVARRFKAENPAVNLSELNKNFEIQERIEKLLDPAYNIFDDPDSCISKCREKLKGFKAEFEEFINSDNPSKTLSREAHMALQPEFLARYMDKDLDDMLKFHELVSDVDTMDEKLFSDLKAFLSLTNEQLILLSYFETNCYVRNPEERKSFEDVKKDVDERKGSSVTVFEFFLTTIIGQKMWIDSNNPELSKEQDKRLIENFYNAITADKSDEINELFSVAEVYQALLSSDHIGVVSEQQWTAIFDKYIS